MKKDNVIGIIGGMGPHAGLDLARKIFDLTPARTDHDHLPVALLSFPARIVDRSTFLFRQSSVNPAQALAQIARQLEMVGAVVAGVPCNTAHAPRIYDALIQELDDTGQRIRLVHMIRETAHYLKENSPAIKRAGVLSTLAVYELGLYKTALEKAGIEAVLPDEAVVRNVVNPTIFDGAFGLKAQSDPVSETARNHLLNAVEHLRKKGAEAVILGCTELPLALPESTLNALPLIDPTQVLARKLIETTYPDVLETHDFESRQVTS